MAYILTPIIDPDDINSSWVDNLDGTYDTSEIHIDAINKIFYFKGAGNLATAGSGITGLALYSFFKDRWQNVPSITKYDFPMLSITNEQFEFIDGWKPDDSVVVAQSDSFNTTTRKMIRTAGWSEVESNNAVTRKYSGIITLGSLGNLDQPYFTQDSALDADTEDTAYTGPVNEAVKIYARTVGTSDISFSSTGNVITSTTTSLDMFEVGDKILVSGTTSNNGTFTVSTVTSSTEIVVTETLVDESNVSATLTVDDTTYFKVYVRTRGKVYTEASLNEIGVTTMTYIVYRFPVSNADDLKLITTDDTEIDVNADGVADVSPYDKITVTYLPNPVTLTGFVSIKGSYGNGITYALGDVVFDTGNSKLNPDGARWYYVSATTGATNGVNMAADTNNTWTLWDKASGGGERWVKDGFYAYSIIIDSNNTVSAGDLKTNSPYTHASGVTIFEIYDWAQWALRQDNNIDEGDTRKGRVADLLVEFIGDTLHTNVGVFVDDLVSQDTNNIVFHDYTNASRLYPLVVAVNLVFNNYLSNDPDSMFYVYYKDPDGIENGNEFGTIGALQVQMSPTGSAGSDVSNNVPDGVNGSSYQFSYAYDDDVTGGRTVSTNTEIVAVAIGLSTGQYVRAEGTITNTGATISLVSPLERNYQNPT